MRSSSAWRSRRGPRQGAARPTVAGLGFVDNERKEVQTVHVVVWLVGVVMVMIWIGQAVRDVR